MKVKIGKIPYVYPVPIVLVGANVQGKPNFETIGDVGLMGINPPLLYVSSGRDHYTNQGILENGAFSINFPDTSLLALTDYCGTVSGREVDKGALFETFYGELGTAPMIEACPVNIECRVIREFSIQHRQVFVAEVVQTYVNDEFAAEKDGRKAIADLTHLDPILYALDNRYYCIGEPIGIGYQEARQMQRRRKVSAQPIVHKEIEAMQIASIKTVVENRDGILPLFEPLRQACGDAICGPAMAVLHYGAVKEGILVEAAFPVSRPVESGQVHTRQLEAARGWTAIHHGAHETLRETTAKVIQQGRTHAGTAARLREVYLTLDPDHPGENVTEIQLIKHEWDRLLAEGTEEILGAAARQQVMAGIEQITPESSIETYTEWIRGAMDRLDSLTDDPVEQYGILSCCAHVFPEERIARMRAVYEQRGDIDDVLREIYKDPAWYEDPIRKGNVLYMRKVPYDPEGYEKGATPAERRKAYCHCLFVRPYLDDGPARMSPTFCWCGSGWYRRLWEGILDQPIQIQHVETLLQGNDQCTLTITLPLALEGEMSPELASLGAS